SLSKKATSFSIPITSLKFPPITTLSFSNARSRDWDDVLTGHAEESFARTWSVGNKKLGKFSFSTIDEGSKTGAIASRGVVKAVHVTACGNFGLAAGSTGTIQLWSMQSGLKRKSFVLGPAPEEVDTRFQLSVGGTGKGGKGRSVTGLTTDALNKVLVVGTLDGTLNFFNFHSKQLEETQVLPSSIVSLLLHRESNLLAVVCDDLTIRMFDLETRRLVREFSGFKGRILDIVVIRTFDIPSGQLIDAFRTPSIANSVSFSPTGDFLATSHVDSVGIYLWANRAQYTEVSWRSSREVEQDVQQDAVMPTLQGTEEEEGQWNGSDLKSSRHSTDPLALEGLRNLGIIESLDIFKRPQETKGDLIELTLLPRARWQTLLHLDVIG
ncbi:6140_t:CDS:2, partial [Acaulospora colombiana]